MRVEISKAVNVQRTARVMQLCGIFDVPPTEQSESRWAFDLPIEDDWQIGLIVGPSGSGKSTVARHAWPDAPMIHANTGYDWPADQSVVDGFPAGMSIRDITAALSSVGFSTPPSWLRPFAALSTGEQFRATLARAILDPAPLVVVDEFTSVVDRQVAKIGSAAVAKAVRRTSKRLVCVTCHYDVMEWLCPDWVLEMPSGEFTRRLLRRPEITIEVTRVHRAAWELFRHHHYLNTTISKTAKCFLASVWGRPAAFASVVNHVGAGAGGGGWREHRTVCLPDFQGVGIGNALSAYVGSVMRGTGRKYYSTTSNPAMIAHRLRSPLWWLKEKPRWRKKVDGGANMQAFKRAKDRLTAGFEYIGPKNTEAARRFGLGV